MQIRVGKGVCILSALYLHCFIESELIYSLLINSVYSKLNNETLSSLRQQSGWLINESEDNRLVKPNEMGELKILKILLLIKADFTA